MNKNSGWKMEEEDLLFREVENGRRSGRPLKSVFETVSKLTGRRPNSVRNYYYLRIKEDASRAVSADAMAAFVPFSEAETHSLLRTVLTAQASGISVRACTLAMGEGDNKAMLRYQNKYRSLIKNNPALVRRVVAELIEEGVPEFDPYETARKRSTARNRKANGGNLLELVSNVINDLDKVEGLDVTTFFDSLGALAVSAAKGAEAIRRLGEADQGGKISHNRLLEEVNELKSQLSDREGELTLQRERFQALLSLYRQLMDVNREFLGMTGVPQISSLSNYIKDLSRNVEECERLMPLT